MLPSIPDKEANRLGELVSLANKVEFTSFLGWRSIRTYSLVSKDRYQIIPTKEIVVTTHKPNIICLTARGCFFISLKNDIYL